MEKSPDRHQDTCLCMDNVLVTHALVVSIQPAPNYAWPKLSTEIA